MSCRLYTSRHNSRCIVFVALLLSTLLFKHAFADGNGNINEIYMNVTSGQDTAPSVDACYPVTTALCNIRSAWEACGTYNNITQKCVINILPGLNSSFDSYYGELTMYEAANVAISGQDSHIISVSNASSSNVTPVEYSFPGFPHNYSVTDTNSAQQNYSSVCMNACGGSTLTFSACGNSSLPAAADSSNTYFRLFVSDSSGNVEVASNDDYCGSASAIQYQVPGLPSVCNSYCLHMGCAGNVACNATVTGLFTNTTLHAPRFLYYDQNLSAVVSPASAVPSLSISGVTFSGFGDVDIPGGTLYLQGALNLMLSAATFQNSSGDAGGALFVGSNNVGVQIENCLFVNNRGSNGGGIYLSDSVIGFNITNTVFDHCSCSSGLGGGVYIDSNNNNGIIRDSQLSGCSALSGGGMYMNSDNHNLSISSTVFSYCSAIVDGGALFANEFNHHLTLSKVIVSDCTSGSDGGGIAIWSNNNFLVLLDVQITRCSAPYGGGLIINQYNDDATITGMNISSCSATYGGAVFVNVYNDYLFITDINVQDCFSSSGGAGMYIYWTNVNATITNVRIARCVSQSSGGGIYISQHNENIALSNLFISDSSADFGGGGLYFRFYNYYASVRNATITGCTAVAGGGGMYVSRYNTYLTVTGLTVSDCSSPANGGGMQIYQYNNHISMTDIVFSGCSAGVNGDGAGGGLSVYQYNNNFVLSGVTISKCTAGGAGGGLVMYQGNDNSSLTSLSISECTSAAVGGGLGLYLSNTNLILRDAVIERCSAVSGGGIGVSSENNGINMSRVSISDSSASSFGGGLFLDQQNNMSLFNELSVSACAAGVSGGGVHVNTHNDHLNIELSAVYNSSAPNGGGLYLGTNDYTTLTAVNITDCIASSNGGGAYLSSMNTRSVMDRTYITACDAQGFGGGGLYMDAGNTAILSASVIAECSAFIGSSVYLSSVNTLDIYSSTLQNCSSCAETAGLYNANDASTVSLVNVSMSSCSLSAPKMLLNVTYGVDDYLNASACYPITTELCNIRSAWEACSGSYNGGSSSGSSNNNSSMQCVINLMPGVQSEFGPGQLVMTKTMDVVLRGQGQEQTLNQGAEAASSTIVFADVFPVTYTTNNTNSAMDNTVIACVNLCGETTVTFSACPYLSSALGDTYFRLFTGTEQVAENDDLCSLISEITYVIPGPSTVCSAYCLHMGCFGSTSCGATVEVTYSPEHTPRFLYYDQDSSAAASAVPSLSIYGVTFSGFGDVDIPGGTLYLQGACRTYLSNMAIANSVGNLGGALFISSNNVGVQIENSLFADSRGSNGGGIYVGDSVVGFGIANTMFSHCLATNGGAMFVSTNNAYGVVSGSNIQFCTGESGGGLYISENNQQLTVSGTHFVSCSASDSGGGIYVRAGNSDLTVSDTNITDCTAVNTGGGVFIYQSNVNIALVDTVIEHCSGANRGGGIAVSASNLYYSFTGCTINNCSTGGYGGGLDVHENNAYGSIISTLFRNNAARKGGGANFGEGNSFTTVAGSTFNANTASKAGGGICLSSYSPNFVLTDSVGGSETLVLQTAHPYAPSIAGETNDPVVVFGMSVSVTNSLAYVLNFDTQTALYAADVLTIYDASSTGTATTTDAGSTGSPNANNWTVLYSYQNTVNYPGVNLPSLHLNVSSFYVELVSKSPSTTNTTSSSTTSSSAELYGFSLYVYPVLRTNDNIYSSYRAASSTTTTDTGTGTGTQPSSFVNNIAGTYGGGLYCYESVSFPVIINSYFGKNSAKSGGGGMFLDFDTVGMALQTVVFDENDSEFDGGAVALMSDQYGIGFMNCLFLNNWAHLGSGGAVMLYSGNGYGIFEAGNEILFQGSVFINNTATVGGAIAADQSNVFTFDNCTVERNFATKSTGGAVMLSHSNLFSATNSLFSGNSAVSCGGGITSSDYSSVYMAGSILYKNSAGKSGGALCLQSSSQYTFANITILTENYAPVGGAVASYSSPLWAVEANDSCLNTTSTTSTVPASACSKVVFIGNKATRGSAVSLMNVQSGANSLTNMLFIGNNASAGGTVFWLYDKTAPVPQEPLGLDSESNVWSGNNAPYGDRVATQAVKILGPQTYTVNDYATDMRPALSFQLIDYYAQVIPLNGTTSVVASIVNANADTCGGRFPFLSGLDMFGDGVVFQDAYAKFAALQAYCAPRGFITLNFEARLGSEDGLTSAIAGDYYVSNQTAVSFRSCHAGEYEHNGECVECPLGSFSLEANVSTTLTCQDCIGISGVSYCFGDQIVLSKGYWRRYDSSTAVLQCPIDRSGCAGGNGTGETVCLLGYQGPLCSVCSEGYFAGDRGCQACDGGAGTMSNVTIAVLVVLGCAFLGTFMYAYNRFFRGGAGTKTTGGTGNKHSETHLEVVMRWWRLRRKDLMPKLKVVLSTYQVASATPHTVAVDLPGNISSFLSAYSFVNLDFASLVPVACTTHYTFIDKLYIVTMIPVALSLVFVILFVAEYSYHRRIIQRNPRRKKGMKQAKWAELMEKYLNYMFYLTYLVLPSVTTTIFQTFLCTNIDPDDENPGDSNLFLTADMSISCTSSYYYDGVVYACIMILVYPIGVPLMYYCLLWRKKEEILHRDQLDEVREEEGKQKDEVEEEEDKISVRAVDKKSSLTSTRSVSAHVHGEFVQNPMSERALGTDETATDFSGDVELATITSTNSGMQTTAVSTDNPTNSRIIFRNSLFGDESDDDGDERSTGGVSSSFGENGYDADGDGRDGDSGFDDGGQTVRATLTRVTVVASTAGELITTTELVETTKRLSASTARLSFLWDAYLPSYWYWEVVETTRRLMLTAVLSVISPGTPVQTVLAVLLSLFYIKIYGLYSPYSSVTNNYLAEMGQYQIFFTFFGELVIAHVLQNSIYNQFIGMILVAINCSVGVALIYYMFNSESTTSSSGINSSYCVEKPEDKGSS